MWTQGPCASECGRVLLLESTVRRATDADMKASLRLAVDAVVEAKTTYQFMYRQTVWWGPRKGSLHANGPHIRSMFHL